MQWTDAVKEQLNALTPVTLGPALAQRVTGLIDLTSLNDTDTDSSIAAFITKARTPYGHVAAVCVYPQFVRMVAAEFTDKSIKTATVVNFPDGDDSLETVLVQIGRAIQDGAQEIDVVFPYTRFLAGERQYAHQFVASCKAACGTDALLKVILETGALLDSAIIAEAAYESLTAGADFIKTSSGKTAQGATLEAAATILLVIKHAMPQLKRRMGIKISGGIRELAQAAQYLELADHIMGREWITPATFRFGASKLVDEIVERWR